ncbi:MAG: methionyl-tRNA formyltransferase [candidate division WOR-3 bacterium]|nr:methionyl-tRNA formyltransferase [candidate division WOR-3 bacterium]
MKVLFWGTSKFGTRSLEAMVQSGYEIIGVVTSPERPSGRGLKMQPSPIKITAQKLNLKIFEPDNPNTNEFYETLRNEQIDICVLVAYGFIIKPLLLGLPSKGFVNLHPSLLPKYRGAAPIQRAIMQGEQKTGVTTFFMNERMDAGPIILQAETEIGINETYDELSERLAHIGAEILLQTLNLIKENKVSVRPQDDNQVTFAPKIKKEECLINWHFSAKTLHNLIRGLSSEPGAWTYFRNRITKILKTELLTDTIAGLSKYKPGEILPNKKSLLVATQDGVLKILSLKIEGGKLISGVDFINGQRVQTGECFVSI